MRRLFAFAVVVAALGGAGVAGAVVEGGVTTWIGQGQWARLGTTKVYCQAFTENQANNYRPAFNCGVWEGNYHRNSTYSAIIDQAGVEVDGRTGFYGHQHIHPVVTYLNP
jgi:hypothetical protein